MDTNINATVDMTEEYAIDVNSLSKVFQIYKRPNDRLKQMIYPRMQYLFSQPTKEYFQKFSALENVSIQVKKGEAVGIIGRNGAGKSTLLQVICGTLHPTAGKVNIKGRVAALLELGSGFNPEFTGRENIHMNAAILGLKQTEIAAKYDDIVAFADIGDFIEQPVKTYSSGMLVRLAFAVIAHVDADILIVDEALSVGDAFFSQKCMRFLRKFMENGTLLFVSHDLGAVLNLCERAVWIQDGTVFDQGKSKDVTEAYLEKLYEVHPGTKATKRQNGELINSAKEDSKRQPTVLKETRDMRDDFINRSNLRNDIELFAFSDNATGFGIGGAKIVSTSLNDTEGNLLSWVVGGEPVELEIACEINNEINSPIVGFQVKDRLGQVVFSDNTYLTYMEEPVTAMPGETLTARFQFTMPILPIGDYTISPAIADGNQHDHKQNHWVHDALAFKVHSTSACLGLVGIPMSNITLENI